MPKPRGLVLYATTMESLRLLSPPEIQGDHHGRLRIPENRHQADVTDRPQRGHLAALPAADRQQPVIVPASL